MVRFILCFIWLIIIPILLGLLLTHYMNKEKNNLFYSIIIGYFIEFAIFQIFTIPYTYKEKSFGFLYNTCLIIIISLCFISIIINRKEFKNIINNILDSIKNTPKIISILVLIIIGLQCYNGITLMHIDEDDSNFVTKATVTWQSNTLFKFDDLGNENKQFPVRYVFSPFPIYTAAVAKFTGFHPMGIAHTIFPASFLVLIYINYYLLGKKFFKDDKKYALVFLLFVNIIYIFGDDLNLHSNFRFALVRLWQGKSILGNLVIPSIILFYNNFIEEKAKFPYWISLLITMFASCFVSSMGFALGTIMICSLTLIFCIRLFRNCRPVKLSNIKTSCISFIKIFIFSILCTSPNILYAILYALEKGGQ